MWALRVMSLALLVTAAAVQTPWAKRHMAEWASRYLSQSLEMPVAIQGITGWLPLHFGIESISVSDDQGPWLEIQSVQTRWLPLDLFRGQLHVRNFDVTDVSVLRRPPPSSSPTDRDRTPGLSLLPMHIDMARISRIYLSGNVTGRQPVEARMEAQGTIFTGQDHLDIEASVQVGTQPASTSRIQWRYENGIPFAQINTDFPVLPVLHSPGEVHVTLTRRQGEIDGTAAMLADGKKVLAIAVTGTVQNIQVTTSVEATEAMPLDLQTTFDVVTLDQARSLTIQQLTGAYQQVSFALLQPLEAVVTGDHVQVARFQGSVEDVPFTVEGQIQGERVEGRLECRNVDSAHVGKLPLQWEDLSLVAMLSGTIHQPRIEVEGSGTELRVLRPSVMGHAPLQTRIHALLENSNLQASLDVEAADQLFLQGTASIPADVSLAPFQASLGSRSLNQASVVGRIDLSLLNDLPACKNLQVSGEAIADLAFDGETDSLVVRGPTQIENGRLVNMALGTELDQLHATFSISENRRLLMQATATAGQGGEIHLQGAFRHDNNTGEAPVNITATLRNAALIERDDVQARVSGRTDILAGPTGIDITGAVTLDSGEIRIDNLAPPRAKPLDVRQIGAASEEAEAPPAPEKERAPLPLACQVDVAIPGPFYVRGRDLDTTWRGTLQALYQGSGWAVNGQLETVRGRVQFLSRSFTLDSGTLFLGGNIPSEPIVDISARHRRGDLTALIRLHGPLHDPVIDLTSIPPLPQDEVFARVLFGKGMSDITTMQAFSLAQTLRTEANGGRQKASVGERVQDRLGLDYVGLQDGASQEEGAEVVLGRQFSNNAYVEFNSSLSGSGSGVRVELELTPRLSVETEAGSRIRPGFGLNWRWNY